MNKIPTAEELIKAWHKSMDIKGGKGVNATNIMQREKLLADAIIEKCKLHVKAALEAAAKEASNYKTNDWSSNKDSILNAYPDKLII